MVLWTYSALDFVLAAFPLFASTQDMSWVAIIHIRIKTKPPLSQDGQRQQVEHKAFGKNFQKHTSSILEGDAAVVHGTWTVSINSVNAGMVIFGLLDENWDDMPSEWEVVAVMPNMSEFQDESNNIEEMDMLIDLFSSNEPSESLSSSEGSARSSSIIYFISST
ncbi:uncharacterized protein F5147DRAFT_766383 [Suillus discolor]|uniref:Uncharacterized protein n=1 Tax=Suillus discolor TaxID=1912936 RepID=A0A9P7FMC9_9AGAM|nr:uncharacterized protein F5147DRAFT_766383 [Suillus discolor]KAG2120463.1 hypothetical protein F5147DRAFT_766383 [Suillus discolor]